MSSLEKPAPFAVNLPAIPSRGAPIALGADAAVLGFSDAAFETVGELRLDGRIERLEREGFRLLARLGGELRLECVRCLGPVGLPVSETLDLVYLPKAAAPKSREGGETALDPSDMNVSFYEGDSLDLSETVWEQLHLALPVKPLCSEACRGLCPSCGADRNRRFGCGCDEPAVRREGGLADLGRLLASR